MNMKLIKIVFVISTFMISLIIISMLFWQQELKYTQPTPVPEDYKGIPVNQVIDQNLLPFEKSAKPKHLHFYNPNCPCSKFNLTHFSSLRRAYGSKIDFYIILASDENYEEVVEKFDHQLPVIIDQDEKIAKACGVYSTPQAVLLDQEGKLYYRGNYNKARYCTSISTSYAQIALDALLAGKPAPVFGLLSTTSYGCELSKKDGFFAFEF